MLSSGLITLSNSQDSLWCTLAERPLLALEGADGGDTLGDRVEGHVFLGLPALLQDLTSLGISLQSEDGDLVDGVESLKVVGRSKSSAGHHPVDILAFGNVWLTDGQLIGSQSTGLVRAQNINTLEYVRINHQNVERATYSQGLDGGELLDNCLLLGQVGSTDSQGGCRDHGQTDGNTDDEEDKGVVKQVDGTLFGGCDGKVAEETTNPCGQDEKDDQNEQGGTDGVHDGLEVTGITGTLDERSSFTDERTTGRLSDNRVGFASFAASGVVADITHVLVDSQRFTGDGRLISSNDGDTDVMFLIVIRVGVILGVVSLRVVDHFLVFFKVVGLVKVADQTGFTGDNGTFFQNELRRVSQ